MMSEAGGNRKAGILTVSDRCFKGESEDKSGPNLKKLLASTLALELLECDITLACAPDEIPDIQKILLKWADELKVSLILTTGGTGFSPRDITPEATKPLLDKEAPGLVTTMITKSLQVTPLAMLSRPVCGIRKSTVIINLPGSKKGAEECFSFIASALPHALDLISGSSRVSHTHSTMESSGGHKEHVHHIQTHTCPHGHAKMHVGKRTKEDFHPVALRPRNSPYPLLSVEDALNVILKEISGPLPLQQNSISESLNCVLGEDVVAGQPLPPFPASIKDGYAVISADGPGERDVLAPITAGRKSAVQVTPGSVARITTGAPLPDGADAVVMVEDTELISSSEDGNTEKKIKILVSSKPGQDIRTIGSDIEKDETVLERGTLLGPSEIGLAAAVGVNKINVYKTPRVAVLSTGNEVVDPGKPVRPGQIFDSNRYVLLAMLKECNCISIDLGIAEDTREALVQQISQGLDDADVLVTSGGVSMGEMDLLKPVLEKDFGAIIHFGRVFMKPGKPTTFASLTRNGKKKLVFALPGNPVSATVTFQLFVLPALKKLAGWMKTDPTVISAKVFKLSISCVCKYRLSCRNN